MNQSRTPEDQALARVEQLIHDTAGALTHEPRLEAMPSFASPTACLDDDQPEAQVVIARAYWLRGVPKSENLAISRQVRSYWESQGHSITGIGRSGSPNLSGESRPDHFLLALVWAEGDDLYLGASSPCIRPGGAPEPS
ncbi:hypothetical protein [Nonomuraea typhae]|uniref:hypothetical protein n=1 Tax=Nonomuraea typhae TaxID=2603600 RepID=UPI0012F8BF08|nr:hypothetical protein [Nonomuraea typhae]